MTYKAHISAGMAVTMLAAQPQTISENIMCLGIASIGSVICDIDVKSSISSKKFNHVLAIMGIAVLAICLVEAIFHVGILKNITSDSNIMRVIIGIMGMVIICLYGKECPHRSFMHSATGWFLMVVSGYIIMPEVALYMGISVASHIILDVFNKKRIQILYPLRKPRIGLGLCKADGVANKIISIVSHILLAGIIIYKIVYFIKQY